MKRIWIIVLLALGLVSGSAGAQREMNTDAMVGKPLEEVVKAYGLQKYYSWPDLDLPPTADPGTTYFLDNGDLQLSYRGEPAAITAAKFSSKEGSAQERFERANAGWNRWLKAHAQRSAPGMSVLRFAFEPPVGVLEEPLGTRLVVEGRKAERVMAVNPLSVEKVNGKAMAQPVNLELKDIDEIKPGVTYTLEGYEAGAFDGPPGWVSREAQQSFGYRAYFVVVRVVEEEQTAK